MVYYRRTTSDNNNVVKINVMPLFLIDLKNMNLTDSD